jgi:hypothetical protein
VRAWLIDQPSRLRRRRWLRACLLSGAAARGAPGSTRRPAGAIATTSRRPSRPPGRLLATGRRREVGRVCLPHPFQTGAAGCYGKTRAGARRAGGPDRGASSTRRTRWLASSAADAVGHFPASSLSILFILSRQTRSKKSWGAPLTGGSPSRCGRSCQSTAFRPVPVESHRRTQTSRARKGCSSFHLYTIIAHMFVPVKCLGRFQRRTIG